MHHLFLLVLYSFLNRIIFWSTSSSYDGSGNRTPNCMVLSRISYVQLCGCLSYHMCINLWFLKKDKKIVQHKMKKDIFNETCPCVVTTTVAVRTKLFLRASVFPLLHPCDHYFLSKDEYKVLWTKDAQFHKPKSSVLEW